jgi:hypothetical protein
MAPLPLRIALDRPVSLTSIRFGDQTVEPVAERAKVTVTGITVTTITHPLG